MGALCSRSHDDDAKELTLEFSGKNEGRATNYVKTARYTSYNFLFKCGFEQFRNLSNVYFLFIVVLALLGTHTSLFESPYSASGTLLALVLVLAFTMAFEGYYDIKRHREDKEVNNRVAFRLRPGDGHMEEVSWADLRPGDLLKVYDRAQFPADLLFVTSCAAGNKCYVETANIDGETNLKIKRVPKDMVDRCILPDQAASLQGRVRYDMPNAFLTFSGTARVYDDKYSEKTEEGYKDIPLDFSNILLRGSVLRNTPWILGIVLYAGFESKVVQSSSNPPSKMSRVQDLTNRIILVILLVGVVMCTVSSLIEIFGYPGNTSLYYLMQTSENTYKLPRFISNFLTFVILYSTLLPISLLFCMTFANFWQAMFVHWDLDMYHKETDTPAKCNTMELVQELGQVSYVFSDKTGTLTRNEMKLVGTAINGQTYGIGNAEKGTGTSSQCSIEEIFSDVIGVLNEDDDSFEKRKLAEFFSVLAVCHTVIVDTTTGSIQYNAEGPDEEALVGAAAAVGIKLLSTDNNIYEVALEVDGNADDTDDVDTNDSDSTTSELNPTGVTPEMSDNSLKFEILATNHFNSTRKRMSVVCRDPAGNIMLYVKGADTIMFGLSNPLSGEDEVKNRNTLMSQLDSFAHDGLRTLVLGKKCISEEAYQAWKVRYDEASNCLGAQRAELLASAAEEIEVGLTIIGATAIEDRLQEGVPETLVALREAGIKTWVLTGDKVETAINIAFSAKLFTSEMELVQITSDDKEENMNTLRQLQQLLVPQNLRPDSEKRKKGRQMGGPEAGSKYRKYVGKTLNKVGEAGRAAISFVSFGHAGAKSPTPQSEIDLVVEGANSFGLDGSTVQDVDNSVKTTDTASPDPDTPTPVKTRKKRRSFLHFWRHLHADEQHEKQNTQQRSEWRRTSEKLPPGVDSTETVNERELNGTEKNLHDFEAKNMSLVVSGAALTYLLSDELGDAESEALLLSLARLCSVVVACRVSPKQKALIVRMVRLGVKIDGIEPITLAIGDGANDVAMIQEARVGVGISGHEGRQAVNSSDFAIAQFRFLQELMLVHGRWNYRRIAATVLYVFYCNIVFVLTAFVFNFFNKFSGAPLYFVFLTTIYSYPTQVPIALMAVINKDISRKTALEYPAMYVSGRRNLNLGKIKALEYIFKSFVHAFIISAVVILWGVPNDIDIATMGTVAYMCCIWVCVSRACLETYTWTYMSFAVVIFGYFVMLPFEPAYYGSDVTIYLQYGPSVIWGSRFQMGYLWACVFLSTAAAMGLDIIVSSLRREYFPSLVDIVIEIDRGYGDEPQLDKTNRLHSVNKLFRKLAQPLVIPANAVSEVLATANMHNVRNAGDRSAFAYDAPEDETTKFQRRSSRHRFSMALNKLTHTLTNRISGHTESKHEAKEAEAMQNDDLLSDLVDVQVEDSPASFVLDTHEQQQQETQPSGAHVVPE
uniref:Phospholipid-transporting ATPase n=1 Tax=Mucochytrium quahogii TaxID=96639 RepID=A0A7S2SL74_9STRA|mmetsp:Transcript_24836/g.40269  ORF Transcript_24836/g.40269 Transcript_24836/m.40269 type:complete len:1438 (+) Transcript_24836:454-4767(+)|eukprot:CAMPEP_0203752888 /NCGR_PEP_ID=MMETSP0098-20131031/6749_1 /ASSEMBLY_ACC=CAM_ASM_000208 /TAXON_ID=96639 /ORGANISM=" , Strain NY0313808BC1" /LENGTH=1437 /DNA_ID=CAMNT_0050643255 /DNA_START=387 /DNA_END=4700 /DNA_ORIENTATION=+